MQVTRPPNWSAATSVLTQIGGHMAGRPVDPDEVAHWIVETGYPEGGRADLDTLALMYTFAASLRNAGGLGPRYDRFANMVLEGTRPFIQENRLIQRLALRDFSCRCHEYLSREGAQSLVDRGRVDYLAQLKQISIGETTAGLLERLMKSVVLFSGLLVEHYNGSASSYHESFYCLDRISDPGQFAKDKFRELGSLPHVGVAVGMNFLKDSQAPGLIAGGLEAFRTSSIGWFVKPDMHVLRLTAFASGRADSARVSDRELCRLPEADASALYAKYLGSTGWPTSYALSTDQPRNLAGKWRCIEDIHHWAAVEKIAPIEIDRTLYLIGSGNLPIAVRNRMTQEERYGRYFAAMRANRVVKPSAPSPN